MTEFQLFIEKNNLLKSAMAEYFSVSNAFITQLCNGSRGLPDDKLAQIKANRDWDTSMFKQVDLSTNVKARGRNNIEINSRNTNTPKEEAKPVIPENTIPIIPMDAHAGSLTDFSDSVMEYQCERMISPIAGATCAIRVSGESMAPEYPNGSIVILKKINERAFVEWGKVYCLDTENGIIIKEVRKTETPQVVECVSLNPDPKYQPFEVNTEYINGWYRVLMMMALK